MSSDSIGDLPQRDVEPGMSVRDEDDAGVSSDLLVVALVALLVSGVTLVIHDYVASIIGYVLTACIAFTCVAFHRRRVVTHAGETGIAGSRAVARLSIAAVVIGLVLTVMHAYVIARHFA